METEALHTLPELVAHSRDQRYRELHDRDEGLKESENREKQISRNLAENVSTRLPLPLPVLTGVNRYSIGASTGISLGQLYCGPCAPTADPSVPAETRTNVTDSRTYGAPHLYKTSPAKATQQTHVTPPLPPPTMLFSATPGMNVDYASGDDNNLNFLYCSFISPDSNKRDSSGKVTIATSTTTTASSLGSNDSNGGSSLSESEIFVGTSLVSPNTIMPLPNNPLAVPSQRSSVEVKSKFFVKGICCTTEVPIVRRILRLVKGVSRVQIQLISKTVIVHHCPETVTVLQLAQTLEDQGFPTKIIHDGSNFVGTDASATNSTSLKGDMEQMERSKFVVSTLSVGHDWSRQNVQDLVKALRDEYKCDHKVRAIHPNSISKTIKVEHDPIEVPVADIAATLKAQCKISVVVAVDGASCNLYMPKGPEGGDSTTTGSVRVSSPSLMQEDTTFLSFNVLRCNVTMSGIFWILSLPSHFEVLESFKYFGLASVAFGLPPILKKAFRTLRRCQFDANCMMTTAAIGAISLQQYDEAASVAFLFSISELLERRASRQAREALKDICDMKPEYANVIHPGTQEITIVPADKVILGSLVSVKTGDKIATDGVIVEGHSLVDESSLTGESVPISKAVGDKVKGGTINIGKTQLVVRTTATVEDSAVSRLIQLVEDAQSNRSETEKLIDSFARTYTPTVMVLALLMLMVPLFIGSENAHQWMLNSLIIIVIACPCSLTISTPVTYAAGLAATAQKGIVVKGGAKLEAMGSVDKVVFDKTGTLTNGVFSLVHFDVFSLTKTRRELLALLALIEGRSSHPVAACLVQSAKDENALIPRDLIMSDHTLLKGEGVSANVGGTIVYVGNQRLFARLNLLDSLPANEREKTNSWAGTGSMIGFIGTKEEGIMGAFCVKDTIRKEARSVVQDLRDEGIEIMLCTGDSYGVANAVANEIGIAPECVRSQMLPEEKYKYVENLKRTPARGCAIWQKQQYVLFCGDGINDAPALATADIGCALGEGAAMAMVTSDITLMDSNLSKITETISIGKKVRKTIKENIILSLLGKLVVVAMTFNGEMSLLLAVGSDVGIMLLVTLNGMKVLSSTHEDPKLAIDKKQLNKDLIEMQSLVGNDVAGDGIV
ncbi:unnamed protein product [Cylindrotheca closterium]|uniref:HMA domain-containing protein n=1 Tax=Cylindrotheca closterium TaxID=2856 RepID=A0AAD2G5R0_9STRA|nr:unnamed protein product [Cylindrotheca closterium]